MQLYNLLIACTSDVLRGLGSWPQEPFHRRLAFDIGDLGLGVLTNSLELGRWIEHICWCPVCEVPLIYHSTVCSIGQPAPLMALKPASSFALCLACCAGCDCLGSIHYFDALMANSKGEAC